MSEDKPKKPSKSKKSTVKVGNKEMVCSCRPKPENSPLGKPHKKKKAPPKAEDK